MARVNFITNVITKYKSKILLQNIQHHVRFFSQSKQLSIASTTCKQTQNEDERECESWH